MDDTPEAWMEKAVGDALTGSAAVQEAASRSRAAVQEMAGLVVQMSEVVSRAADAASEVTRRADETRQAVVGLSYQWLQVKPRLAHYRRLLSGAVTAGMMLVPPDAGAIRHGESPSGRDPLAVEKEARDRPERERYSILATLARDRGEAAAEAWFIHKAAVAGH